jgi:hypothetical protein
MEIATTTPRPRPNHEGEQAMRSNFRFSTFALVVSLCGCAHEGSPPTSMISHPHNHPVTLDVQRGSVSGYIQIYGSDGNVYSYLYTGGDDGQGGLKINYAEKPDVTEVIRLTGGYEIGKVYFLDDDYNQLFNEPLTTHPKNVVIHDKNKITQTQVAFYKIIVHYTNSSGNTVKIACDPRIVNN